MISASHRGHRLGLLIKIANLRAIMAASPTTGEIVTWNAADNAPMIAVNASLGFAVGAGGDTWEKTLASS